jgi:putative solute:sodium symporter small subunit
METSKRPLQGWLRAVLLLLVFCVSFGGCFLARDWISPLPMWGGPFSYWLAAQGAVLVFILVTGLYAAVMNRRDEALDEKPPQVVEAGPHV